MERVAAPPEGVQQTQFAYIGDITTEQGTYHIATQRRILTGMLAPRGLPPRLLLFDTKGQLAAAYRCGVDGAEPLWCQGSRVYLFGYGSFPGAETDSRLLGLSGDGSPPTGNVLDFARGPTLPLLTREKRYGSSGGIADDPWHAEN